MYSKVQLIAIYTKNPTQEAVFTINACMAIIFFE